MHLLKLNSILFFLASLFFVSCDPAKKSLLSRKLDSTTVLHFLGELDIPYNLQYNNSTVGGLSGIDYDAANKL